MNSLSLVFAGHTAADFAVLSWPYTKGIVKNNCIELFVKNMFLLHGDFNAWHKGILSVKINEKVYIFLILRRIFLSELDLTLRSIYKYSHQFLFDAQKLSRFFENLTYQIREANHEENINDYKYFI